MSIQPHDLAVINNSEAKRKRFEVHLGDEIALIEYILTPDTIVFTHTEVPAAYRGQGVAERIAEVALDYARAHGLAVNPLCPFVASYIRRNPRYRSLVLQGLRV